MKKQSVRPIFIAMMMCALLSLLPVAASAQQNVSTLAGTVKDAAGTAVHNAKVVVTNATNKQSIQTQTDAAGRYIVRIPVAGDYEISISAEGYSTNTLKVSIEAGQDKTQDVTLGGVLSLGDLGFTSAQAQGSSQDQARLDKRSHMLKVHQRLGLIAAVPMVATVIAGAGAGGKSTSSADRWAHMALGSATADLYFTSAYFAIRAPRIPGTQTRGQIRFHKILAWIHGPGMVMSPILGAIAFNQKSKGERVHGIASAHGPVAIVTAAAYGAAILSVSVKF